MPVLLPVGQAAEHLSTENQRMRSLKQWRCRTRRADRRILEHGITRRADRRCVAASACDGSCAAATLRVLIHRSVALFPGLAAASFCLRHAGGDSLWDGNARSARLSAAVSIRGVITTFSGADGRQADQRDADGELERLGVRALVEHDREFSELLTV